MPPSPPGPMPETIEDRYLLLIAEAALRYLDDILEETSFERTARGARQRALADGAGRLVERYRALLGRRP
jgi:hypothetical protein